MTRLFFISSSGSMATKWMSELLSAGSSVKCFHGSLGLQATYDAVLDTSAALSLAKKWGQSHNVKYVGINHLSMKHGVKGLGACEEIGATFCALVRNPIITTDSQYQERIKSEHLPKMDLAQYAQLMRDTQGIREIADPVRVSDVVFFRSALSAISHLLEVEISDCETFRFEKYTQDYSEVRKLILVITNGAILDDHNIASAFETLGKTNTHRRKTIGVEETWKSSWSDKQRQIFVWLWRHLLNGHSRRVINYPDVESLIQSSG